MAAKRPEKTQKERWKWVLGALAVWLVIPFLGAGAERSAYSVRWNTNANQTAVEVSGISGSALRQLKEADWQAGDWQKLLAVYAGGGGSVSGSTLPAMLGSYQVADGVIRFQPRFPIEPGVTYRAVFRPDSLPGAAGDGSPEIVSVFRPRAARRGPATVVTQVYPSGKVLPANLLKFYLHFSAPMSRGHIYEHIHLIDDAGKEVELPFLEIDQELWNPEMTRLTLFIDPGRIKRGVQPLEEIGPVLVPGRSYTLVVDRAWQDAQGNPLKETYRKRFKADPPARQPLDAAKWNIRPPRSGSLEALRLRFPAPMDHALAQRMIRVTDRDGRQVPGEVSLRDAEREWRHNPANAWLAGQYRIVVETAIEDLVGNNIGKPFEVDLFDGVQERIPNVTVSLDFYVR